MLKPIYQPSDHCRNSLRNRECAHCGEVRGLLLCTFIPILQVEVCEIGPKCPLPALRQEPKPCQGRCPPAKPERGCPSRLSYGCFQSLPRAFPVSSDSRNRSRKAETAVTVADGNLANPLHLLRGLVQSREGAVHTGASSLSARGHERKITFSEI